MGLDAFDKQGNLMKPKERAINKIGVSCSFAVYLSQVLIPVGVAWPPYARAFVP